MLCVEQWAGELKGGVECCDLLTCECALYGGEREAGADVSRGLRTGSGVGYELVMVSHRLLAAFTPQPASPFGSQRQPLPLICSPLIERMNCRLTRHEYAI